MRHARPFPTVDYMIGWVRNAVVEHVQHAFMFISLTKSIKWWRKITIFEVVITTRALSDKSFILNPNVKTIRVNQIKGQFAPFIKPDQRSLGITKHLIERKVLFWSDFYSTRRSLLHSLSSWDLVLSVDTFYERYKLQPFAWEAKTANNRWKFGACESAGKYARINPRFLLWENQAGARFFSQSPSVEIIVSNERLLCNKADLLFIILGITFELKTWSLVSHTSLTSLICSRTTACIIMVSDI